MGICEQCEFVESEEVHEETMDEAVNFLHETICKCSFVTEVWAPALEESKWEWNI